jgi:uncharacterized DUF497 family protein
MEFEWDNGNLLKSLIKHGITQQESEQVFLGTYLMEIDETHSIGEIRFKLLGKTHDGKILHIIFTTRTNKIRIISSRPASKNERNIYEAKKVKENP